MGLETRALSKRFFFFFFFKLELSINLFKEIA